MSPVLFNEFSEYTTHSFTFGLFTGLSCENLILAVSNVLSASAFITLNLLLAKIPVTLGIVITINIPNTTNIASISTNVKPLLFISSTSIIIIAYIFKLQLFYYFF